MDFSQMTQKWSSKPKPDPAARVRENQRRHRAKTKAYVADLENELAEMRKRLDEVLQHNARLVSEVEDLRCRLEDTSHATDSHVTPLPPPDPVPRQVPVSAHEPIESTRQDASSAPLPRDITYTTLLIPTSIPTPVFNPFHPQDSPQRLPDPGGCPASRVSSTPHNDENHCAGDGGANPSLCEPQAISLLENLDISTLRTSCSHLPPPRPGESTIPCTTAYGIITQQNYGGHDLSTITSLLRPGFRRATLSGDDCHVMSSLVFAVVDTISSP